MKAILLAAGVGSRLGELTRSTPKCLLPINGRPLLDYWLETLAKAGVDEALINTHHLPDQVEAFLHERASLLKVRSFYEPELLGSAGTLREAWDFVAGAAAFFIIYADNFARVDLRRLYEFHASRGNPLLTLLAYPADEPSRCGILELDANGRVLSFEEKPPQPRSRFANAGIHVAGPGLRAFLPEKTPADIGFDMLPRLVGRMYGYVTAEYILDIGTPETYARVQQLVSAGKV